MGRLLREASQSFRALGRAIKNPGILGLQLSWLGANIAEFGLTVAVGVYAFEKGGATAVGALSFVLYVPPLLVAPIVAPFGDRYGRKLLLHIGLVGRAVFSALTAVAMFSDWPLIWVFVVLAFCMAIGEVYWATKPAVVPSLARSAEELSASNAASGLTGSIGTLLGSLVAAAVLGISTLKSASAWVVVLTAVIFALSWASLILVRLPRNRLVIADEEEEEEEEGLVAEMIGGFKYLAVEGDTRTILILNLLQCIGQAAAVVLAVVAALSPLFNAGEAGAALLNAAIGVGAMVGSVGAVFLIGRRSLAALVAATLIASAVAFGVIGALPVMLVAVLMFAAIGAAFPLGDVASITLVQRLVPDEFLGRVMGIFDAMIWLGWAIGGVATGWTIEWIGIRYTILAFAVFLPLYGVVRWRMLRRIDLKVEVAVEEIGIIRRLALFAPLSVSILEEIARRLKPEEVSAGEAVITQGDPGDKYYAIAEGNFEIVVNGVVVNTIGPGDGFGEVALLTDAPRNATVRAVGPGKVFSLEREPFLAAVTGHSLSRAAAQQVVSERSLRSVS